MNGIKHRYRRRDRYSIAVVIVLLGSFVSPVRCMEGERSAEAVPVKSRQEQFFDAVCNGQGQKVACMIQASVHHDIYGQPVKGDGDIDVNAEDQYGHTALLLATYKRDCNMVMILLNAKADVEAGMKRIGLTPLHEAARCGSLAIVQALLERKANPNAIDMKKNTPLHCVARCGHRDVVQALLDAKADPNVIDDTQETPLHKVAPTGHGDVVQALMGSKALVNVINAQGKTPLHLAEMLQMYNMLKRYGAIECVVSKVGVAPHAAAEGASVCSVGEHDWQEGVREELARMRQEMAGMRAALERLGMARDNQAK